jgi:hypothetical protein
MTSKQLERKAKQLYSRRRLIHTIEELEEAIKAFITVEGRSEIHTEKFTISLVEGRLDISVRTSIDPNQLALNFIKSKDKEDFNNESVDPQETITGRTRLGQRRRVKTHRPANP